MFVDSERRFTDVSAQIETKELDGRVVWSFDAKDLLGNSAIGDVELVVHTKWLLVNGNMWTKDKITPHRLLNLKVICCIILERNLMCLPRTIVMYNTIILPNSKRIGNSTTNNGDILDFINRSSKINNL
ncbi:unnamed protein product [Brugia pahangi]|uniref:Uncharacterized protein n=1 Tax=Brugia pahangi TaxID=6280 RepID=A0A0N4TJI7_BRUPA|nr:unnamed protein product [Brugia pahangi]